MFTRPGTLKKVFFVVALVCLWFLPWGKVLDINFNIYISFFGDLIRVVVALVMFILTGALLYLLVGHKDGSFSDWSGLFIVGFAFSVAILGLVGLLGRLLGFSFSTVKTIFALWAVIELILLFIFSPNIFSKTTLLSLFRGFVSNIPLLAAIIIATLLTFHDSLFFIDDTTYVAYVTHWQKSSQLGFLNIIHEPIYIELERFWLAMYPMSQAVIADLSGVPAVLLFSNYGELLLVPMAVLASYWFSRNLGLSRHAAGFSVLIQISLYGWLISDAWPVGIWFFQSMIEDKVAAVFNLSPVFFVFILRYIQGVSKRNLFYVFLSGLALTLTHPVSLFFSCLVASGVVVLSWFTRKTCWRTALTLLFVFFAIMSPYLFIRYFNYSSQAGFTHDVNNLSQTFQVEQYTNILDDNFYGMNPEVLKFIDLPADSTFYFIYQYFRLTPIFLVLIGCIIAIKKIKEGPLYWYIFSSAALVFFAVIPYTGWILGFLSDARLIYRASWLSPLGLSGLIVLQQLADFLKAKNYFKNKFLRKVRYETIALLSCILFVFPVVGVFVSTRATHYFDVLNDYKQLAYIGEYIDENSSGSVVVTSTEYWIIQILPGVSANTRLTSFREEKYDNGHNFFLSIEEIRRRIQDDQTIRSLDPLVPSQERCSLIESYQVRFVISKLIDKDKYQSIVAKCGIVAYPVFQTRDFILLELMNRK